MAEFGKRAIPQYGTVTLNGIDYYRTRVQNADGKLVALYARTPEELYDKELGALEQIDNDTFCRKSPTVADYCEKWLLMQSVHVRATTLIDYTSKVRRHIIKELGQMRMADVTAGCHSGTSAVCICHVRAVCRIAARRNSCPKKGFCISECGLSLFNGAHGTRKITDR